MGKIVLGIAGVWHVHTMQYLKEINRVFSDRIVWKYICSDDEDLIQPAIRETGAKRVQNLQEMLDDPEVDAIICEERTCMHKDIILKSIQAGKHIYTDKVLTITKEDAEEIRAAVQGTRVKFAVSHESVPTAPYQYAKKLITEGILGDVVSMHFRRAHGLAKQHYPEGILPEDWYEPQIAGGGALIDLGIHGVSLLPYYCGKPEHISAFTGNRNGHESEDSATIMVKFENGAIGTAHTDMTTSFMENNMEILGTEGILTINGMEGTETVMLQSNLLPEYKKGMTPVDRSSYQDLARPFPVIEFISLIMDENSSEQSPEGLGIHEAVMAVSVVNAAYQSAKEKKAVRL